MVRPATFKDLKAIVNVHSLAFPNYFLTKLGPSFLKIYYELVISYDYGIILVSDNDGEINGFVAGFIYPESFYKYLRKFKWELGRSIAYNLLLHPNLFPRILLNFLRTKEKQEDIKYPISEIASVGVKPASSKSGIGTMLIKAFIKVSKDLGSEAIILKTDALNNEQVNKLYKKIGFTIRRQFVAPIDRLMNEYIIRIAQ